MTERKCAKCDAGFTPRVHNQKYCSAECRRQVRVQQSLKWYYSDHGQEVVRERRKREKQERAAARWRWETHTCFERGGKR